MADRYRIRQANPADTPAVLAIERSVFTDPWTESAFGAFEEGVALVGVHDHDVVGYLVARQVGEEAEILNLAVHQDHRRAGLGSRLMRAALNKLAGAGVREVFLEVRETNQVAGGFYRKLGFSEVGRRRHYYRQPVEDALILSLRLDPETRSA
jgi:ribosomal-protein-alanine N-acetyltransferase